MASTICHPQEGNSAASVRFRTDVRCRARGTIDDDGAASESENVQRTRERPMPGNPRAKWAE
jgi:hypothetical protein